MADGAMGYSGGLGRRELAGDVIPALPAALRRISWGSVFAGLIVAVMVSLVLATLGMSIGLGTVDPMQEANPFSSLGIGAAIWWVASSLIALFCGGWVAARMAGMPRGFDGAVHGVLTWGLVTLLTFYFLGTALGRMVGGVSSLVGQGFSVMGKGAADLAPQAAESMKEELRQHGMTVESVQREAADLLRQTGKPGLQPGAISAQASQAGQTARTAATDAAQDPSQATSELSGILRRIADQGKGVASQADKDAAANIIVARTGKSRAEADAIVGRWSASLQQASQKLDQAKAQAEMKAREWGDAAAAGMSKASLWTFIALLLGGFCAALGGRFGIPREVPTLAPRP
jgi:hypothetical protein